MVHFYEWLKLVEKQRFLEMVATQNKTGSGNGIIDPPDKDDGNGNNDESEWSWEELQKRWATKVERWSKNAKDPGVIKCRRAIIEVVFSTKPQVEVEEQGEYAKHFYASVKWHIPNESPEMDKIEKRVIQTLRMPEAASLWKILDIQLEEVWNVLNKRDVDIFLVVHILRGFVSNELGNWVKFELTQHPQVQIEIDKQAYTLFGTNNTKKGGVTAGGGQFPDGFWATASIYYELKDSPPPSLRN